MIETILAYSGEVSAGVIRTRDGKTYYFSKAGWRSPDNPKNDMSVTFAGDCNNARHVLPAPMPPDLRNSDFGSAGSASFMRDEGAGC